jgi:nitroimidazol reductase NimA-like FMN-containing flavoprotein (pyridoxamine 5'-phosphate oxidase superfamily)
MRSTLTEAEASFVRWARVARLASTGRDGMPHVVPVCPVLDDDGALLVCLERDSVKHRNVEADPRVALVFDDYREDWGANAAVLVRGQARFLEGDAWSRARALLYDKFIQYEPLATIEDDPIVAISPDQVASWGI